jgi:hypothetical protein
MNHNEANWAKFKQELAKVNAQYSIKQYEAVQRLVRLYADNPSDITLLVNALNAIVRLPIAFDIIATVDQDKTANELMYNKFIDTSKWTEDEIAKVLYPEDNHMQKARDIEKEHNK